MAIVDTFNCVLAPKHKHIHNVEKSRETIFNEDKNDLQSSKCKILAFSVWLIDTNCCQLQSGTLTEKQADCGLGLAANVWFVSLYGI